MTDEMMITIMGALAQEESTSISQNMRWSIQKRMQNGTYKNATPPFGFKKENGMLIEDEDQVAIVRWMFEWYCSGYGLQAIADKLNSNNVPSSKQSVLWKADNVKYVLKNERYIGNAVYQKSYVTENLLHIKKGTTAKNRNTTPKTLILLLLIRIFFIKYKHYFYPVIEILSAMNMHCLGKSAVQNAEQHISIKTVKEMYIGYAVIMM